MAFVMSPGVGRHGQSQALDSALSLGTLDLRSAAELYRAVLSPVPSDLFTHLHSLGTAVCEEPLVAARLRGRNSTHRRLLSEEVRSRQWTSLSYGIGSEI